MDIRFWGVRGSLPAPMTPGQFEEKLNEILQRITPDDVKSPETKKAFLDSLPTWLRNIAGGNTPCVEFTSEKGEKIIFDAGTGIRVMGKNGTIPENFHYNLIFSHFHWDHIQGLPFFDHAYNPKAMFDVYSPFSDMRDYLSNQMELPYYPVKFEAFTKNFIFHTVTPGKEFDVDGLKVNCIKMCHPGNSYSYSVTEGKKKFVYATDVELKSVDFDQTPERASVFENADVMVFDSQYTVEEAIKKENWGHSAFCYAIDFAAAWKVKKLYLFHHEPTYDDKKLDMILESARLYSDYISDGSVEVYLASEGMEIKI